MGSCTQPKCTSACTSVQKYRECFQVLGRASSFASSSQLFAKCLSLIFKALLLIDTLPAQVLVCKLTSADRGFMVSRFKLLFLSFLYQILVQHTRRNDLIIPKLREMDLLRSFFLSIFERLKSQTRSQELSLFEKMAENLPRSIYLNEHFLLRSNIS